jgi:hypothetical protein
MQPLSGESRGANVDRDARPARVHHAPRALHEVSAKNDLVARDGVKDRETELGCHDRITRQDYTTGVQDGTTGRDYRTGLQDGTTGRDYRTGLHDRITGLNRMRICRRVTQRLRLHCFLFSFFLLIESPEASNEADHERPLESWPILFQSCNPVAVDASILPFLSSGGSCPSHPETRPRPNPATASKLAQTHTPLSSDLRVGDSHDAVTTCDECACIIDGENGTACWKCGSLGNLQ